ncbi:MAG: ATP-binding cassette domain-containing protein, partial [Candidatus Peribacteraceae bacterium]
MIVFSSVTKEYHGRPVVKDVSFTVQPGEFVCITGPSGAGKSTLIHLLIRAEYPTSGTIEVDGADIAKLPVTVLQMYRRNMGVVFQDYKLLEDRTVAENIAFALEVSGESDQVILERLEEVLSDLKLTEQAQMFPAELSGGEKTRTALARALVHQPSILVTDEPTGNIDPVQSLEIIKLL